MLKEILNLKKNLLVDNLRMFTKVGILLFLGTYQREI